MTYWNEHRNEWEKREMGWKFLLDKRLTFAVTSVVMSVADSTQTAAIFLVFVCKEAWRVGVNSVTAMFVFAFDHRAQQDDFIVASVWILHHLV